MTYEEFLHRKFIHYGRMLASFSEFIIMLIWFWKFLNEINYFFPNQRCGKLLYELILLLMTQSEIEKKQKCECLWRTVESFHFNFDHLIFVLSSLSLSRFLRRIFLCRYDWNSMSCDADRICVVPSESFAILSRFVIFMYYV